MRPLDAACSAWRIGGPAAADVSCEPATPRDGDAARELESDVGREEGCESIGPVIAAVPLMRCDVQREPALLRVGDGLHGTAAGGDGSREGLARDACGGDAACTARRSTSSSRWGCIDGSGTGAWVRGDSSSFWGTGKGGAEGCESCCYVCDGEETPVIVIAE